MMKRIAMILRTNGLEYDDRIRKEMLTIRSLYPEVEFKIFAMLDGQHSVCERGVTNYGIEYVIPLLKTRQKYKSGTHLIEKAWEFYSVVTPELKDYDIIWCADFEPFFFLLLSGKPKVWDMHELPEMFLGTLLRRNLLRFLMKRCKVVIHANSERLQYLDKIGVLKEKRNQYVIRNFPELTSEVQCKNSDKYLEFVLWLGDSDCVYIQGINDNSRCDVESVEAVMKMSKVKAVVVGRVKPQLEKFLREKYGAQLDQKIFFTGMVPQVMTSCYVRKCKVSLVLYRNVSPNNYYCEPNRMFQSIINDCPVVVGCNPSMKELIEQYNFGVTLADDGSNVTSIVKGLEKVLAERLFYCGQIAKNKHVVLWERQKDVFVRIMSTLL